MDLSEEHKTVGTVQRNERFLRIGTLVNHAGYELYCDLFFDPNGGGFPKQPDILYKELMNHKTAIQSLKSKGDISEEDFLQLFPPSEETFLQECSLTLLHKLAQVCVKRFPRLRSESYPIENGVTSPITQTTEKTLDEKRNKNECYDALVNITYINQLEKLQTIITDEKLQTRVNSSQSEFDAQWKQITDILEKLGYDIAKVDCIRTVDNLDNCRTCHVAHLKAQSELLSHECDNLFKVTEVNTLTLNRLISNLKEATSLEKKEIKEDDKLSPLKDMKDLKDSIEISCNMLKVANESIKLLFGELKFWREKNIEGDLIILDESLNKLRFTVGKQSRSVSNYFNTVSFDIVKIKEKMSSEDGRNIKHISTPKMERK